MKSILIVANALDIGGAERALISLLNTIDTQQYKVDLFLLKHTGNFMDMIPKNINLLPQIDEFATLGVPIKDVLRKKKFKQGFGRLIGKIKAWKFKKTNSISGVNGVEIEYSYKYTKKYMPMISYNEYDLVIGFSTPFYFVDEKTKGKKKIAWIHTDYSSIPGDTESELRVWSIYDYIISISDSVTKSFIKKYPTLKEKIILIENIISPKFIEQQANLIDISKEMKREDNTINLLSIGRFCSIKNFTSIPEICAGIVKNGIKVRWYLIGYGAEEKHIKDEIFKFGMQDNVIILGKKINPYPYIKQCDIYVQPSKFEGKSVSIMEAKVLGKPVIVTNFPTAKDQIVNNYDGIIVPMDNDECSKHMVTLLKDKKKIDFLTTNCKKTNYGNEVEVEKIYKLI